MKANAKQNVLLSKKKMYTIQAHIEHMKVQRMIKSSKLHSLPIPISEFVSHLDLIDNKELGFNDLDILDSLISLRKACSQTDKPRSPIGTIIRSGKLERIIELLECEYLPSSLTFP